MKKYNTNSPKIYAFIDSQNLNLGVQNLGWRLDFKKFRTYLREKLDVEKAILFIGYIHGYQKLYRKLKRFGYQIVFKPTVTSRSGKVKGNIDAELVLHAAKIEYPNYDKAAVVTGDGDFYCMLKDMVEEKRLHRLIIPNRKAQSILLKEFEPYKVFVDKLRDKVEKNGGAVLGTETK